MRIFLPKPDFKEENEKHPSYDLARDNIRYVVVSGRVEKLTRDPDTDLYKDEWGVIWALPDYDEQTDKIARCGVGFLSFDIKNPLTSYCSVHDYMYSSPTFQYFHTRYEADVWLYKAIQNHSGIYRIFATPFYYITRYVGKFFWENKTTQLEEAICLIQDFNRADGYSLLRTINTDKSKD